MPNPGFATLSTSAPQMSIVYALPKQLNHPPDQFNSTHTFLGHSTCPLCQPTQQYPIMDLQHSTIPWSAYYYSLTQEYPLFSPSLLHLWHWYPTGMHSLSSPCHWKTRPETSLTTYFTVCQPYHLHSVHSSTDHSSICVCICYPQTLTPMQKKMHCNHLTITTLTHSPHQWHFLVPYMYLKVWAITLPLYGCLPPLEAAG